MSEADFNQIKGITKGLLRLYQRQVRGLASALLDRGAITGSEIAEVVKHYMKRQVS
jgi:hypothetical protein